MTDPQSPTPHWTGQSTNTKKYRHRIIADVIEQLRARVETAAPISPFLSAEIRAASNGEWPPSSLSLNRLIKLVQAAGLKLSIVAYDDGDPANERGPVNAEIFVRCWQARGRPRDFFDLEEKAKDAQSLRAEIARLQAGGCARDQGLTQFCWEAMEKARALDWQKSLVGMLKQQLTESEWLEGEEQKIINLLHAQIAVSVEAFNSAMANEQAMSRMERELREQVCAALGLDAAAIPLPDDQLIVATIEKMRQRYSAMWEVAAMQRQLDASAAIESRLHQELTESQEREGEKQSIINQLRAELAGSADAFNQLRAALDDVHQRAATRIGLRREIERILGVGDTLHDAILGDAVARLRELKRLAEVPTDEELVAENLRVFIDHDDPDRDFVAVAINRPSISGIGSTKAQALMHLAVAENGVIEALEGEVKSWQLGTVSRTPQQAEEQWDGQCKLLHDLIEDMKAIESALSENLVELTGILQPDSLPWRIWDMRSKLSQQEARADLLAERLLEAEREIAEMRGRIGNALL